MILVWVFLATGCQNFEDYRTPYKSSISIAFKPINKNDKLPDIEIIKRAVDRTDFEEELSLERHPENTIAFATLSLNPKSSRMELVITHADDSSLTKTLTIYYQTKAILISHQCGCAYKYEVNKVEPIKGVECKIRNKELSTLNEYNIDLEIRL